MLASSTTNQHKSENSIVETWFACEKTSVLTCSGCRSLSVRWCAWKGYFCLSTGHIFTMNCIHWVEHLALPQSCSWIVMSMWPPRGNLRCPAQTVSLKDQPSHLQVFWLDNLILFLMTAGQSGNRDRMIDVWGQFFWFWCLNVKWLVLCIFDSRFWLIVNFSRLEIIVLIQKNVFIKLMKW